MEYTLSRNEEYSFDYASQILGLTVRENDRILGQVKDILFKPGELYPEVEGVCVESKLGDFFLPLPQIHPPRTPLPRVIEARRHDLTDMPDSSNLFQLRSLLWDKQIVDMQGAKVKRVNDIQLLNTLGKTYVINVDVGFTGILRRLGFEGGVRKVANLLRAHLQDELISWKHVQTLEEGKGPGPIHLAIDHGQLAELHPGELADILEDLNHSGRVALLNTVTAETSAEALEEMETEEAASIVEDMDPNRAADILEEIEPSVAVDILSEVDADQRDLIKAHMETEDRREIEELEKFEDQTAGALMSTGYIKLPVEGTVEDALRALRQEGDEVDMIQYLFLVHGEDRLIGVLGLRRILFAPPETRLVSLMSKRMVAVQADQDWEDVADLFYKYNFLALPVVDKMGTLLGVIRFQHTFDDLVPYYYRLARA